MIIKIKKFSRKLSIFQFVQYVIGFMLVICCKSSSASCLGCVELDEITFPKLLSKFNYSLIKFDIAFPYGEKHEAFGEFARKIGATVDELFVGLVGIKDYGEKENSRLGEKYKVDDKKFPVILLFKNSKLKNNQNDIQFETENEKLTFDEFIKYPEDTPVTVDDLKQFIKENSDLYIGLEGCLKNFDLLVNGFVKKTVVEQKSIMENAIQLKNSYKHNGIIKKADIYITLMSKIIEKSDTFVPEERRRLENLIKGKISDNKKIELSHRLNILQSFSLSQKTKKDEL